MSSLKKPSKRILTDALGGKHRQKKIDAYNRLQSDFNRLNGLTHFDKSRTLYADVNASKSGFDVMIYHVKNDVRLENKSSIKKQIDSIMFLNKILISIKSRYGPTKLKMTDLIGTIKRIAHMIKSTMHFMIVYIDHDVNLAIIDQIKLNTINIDKLNLKLIKTSTYLSQFRLIVRHRSNKSNIISNALNKLFINAKTNFKIDLKHYRDNMKNFEGINDNYSVNETLIIINDDFKKKILDDYIKKKMKIHHSDVANIRIAMTKKTRKFIIEKFLKKN